MCDKNTEEFRAFPWKLNFRLLSIKTGKSEIAAIRYDCNLKQIKTLINLLTGNVSCNSLKNGW